MRFLIGIDNGSQSTKVSIFDESGNVMSEARQSLRPSDSPRPGVVEHPDDDLWETIGEACRRAMAGFKGDVKDIAGIGLCTIRFCRAHLREDGSLASPVMSWMDDRVSRPYEQRDSAVRYVTTSSGYITHRLTGQFKDTVANYQGVWPINTDRWDWLRDDEGFGEYGIRRDMLFELVMPGDLLGTITAEAAQHCGIPEGLPVVATANDKAVEALGSGLRSPGTLLVSLGTYIASMTVGHDNQNSDAFWSNFGSRPHIYLYESPGIRRGMWTVSWWRDLLGDELMRHAGERGISVDALLDEEAAKVPAGSEGLLVTLDWLAPTNAPYRRGSILGFDVRHGQYHIYRAIIEGIVLTIYQKASAMARELNREFDRIVVSGGGSNSDVFMQAFADAFNLPTSRCAIRDGAGLGSAIYASVGLGIHSSWDDAIDRMVTCEEAFTPNELVHDLYQRLSVIHGQITTSTDNLYRQIFELFN